MSNLPINNQHSPAAFIRSLGYVAFVIAMLLVVVVGAGHLPQTPKSSVEVVALGAPLAVVNVDAESAPFVGGDYEDLHATGPFPYSPWTENRAAATSTMGSNVNAVCGKDAGQPSSGFVDSEPVLFIRTTAWDATSKLVCQLYPYQTKAQHERTVFYRVTLLDPTIDWTKVPAGMPFMSKRGIAG